MKVKLTSESSSNFGSTAPELLTTCGLCREALGNPLKPDCCEFDRLG